MMSRPIFYKNTGVSGASGSQSVCNAGWWAVQIDNTTGTIGLKEKLFWG